MAKFKFASNFGLQKGTIEFLSEKVLRENRANLQKRLSEVNNEEFIDLYVFVKYSTSAIEKRGIQK